MSLLILDSKTVQQFRLFSGEHLITLGILLAGYFLLYLKRRNLQKKNIDKAVRFAVGTLLLLVEGGTLLFNLSRGTWFLASSLPLQLCDILVILSSLLMFTKNYRVYEFVYLLGLAGASQALITPDLAQGFPQFQFYAFFLSHGLIIFSALYMTFVHNYRPSRKSIPRTYLGLNLSLPFIGLVNYLTGGDYFFLAGKPETPSLLDYLGPWPWYILSLEIAALILLFIPYLPFFLKDRLVLKAQNAGRPSTRL